MELLEHQPDLTVAGPHQSEGAGRSLYFLVGGVKIRYPSLKNNLDASRGRNSASLHLTLFMGNVYVYIKTESPCCDGNA